MAAPSDRISVRTALPRGVAGHLLADVSAFTALAQEVEDAMAGGVLRYSDRLRLLKRARHFGIKRFDANLVIAMVQNRARLETSPFEAPPARVSWLRIAAVVLTLQSGIVAAAWWVMR